MESRSYGPAEQWARTLIKKIERDMTWMRSYVAKNEERAQKNDERWQRNDERWKKSIEKLEGITKLLNYAVAELRRRKRGK